MSIQLAAAYDREDLDESGPMPTAAPMDELLDDRLAHRDGARLGRGRR
ncbi:MAG: hypothetical protein JOZ23_20110 [Mycobacterium sp.]|nr:hypothetical protein [Mycobacterium sp.]MBV9353808.1 hypothetical protein [Mycobacterium sp.]